MISIIFISYKSDNKLVASIKSVLQSRIKVKFEIIVVENSQSKNLEERLRSINSKIKYLNSEANLGYGNGCNLGAKYAKGEYLFFLNPDTVLLKDTVGKLIEFINKKNNIGAISPLLLDSDRSVREVVGSQFPTPLRAIFSLSIVHKIFPGNLIARNFFLKNIKKNKPFKVDVFPGTAFMMRKQVFEEVGGFDEKYFLFYEESDLARKLAEKGYVNYIVPSSKLVHIGKQSTKHIKDVVNVLSKSRFYFFKKWYGFPTAFFLEIFFRFKKEHLFLIFIALGAIFLRLYRLDSSMQFIGDQGWFYISARDAILNKELPLVGITSSHTWLHQGPYWTYILMFIFGIFGFNPLIPAYLIGIISAVSIFLVYLVVKDMVGKAVGLISSALYATSPLIILNDRFPYHTTFIPLISIVFAYSLFRWLKGSRLFFILSVSLVGVLYNFELATFSLSASLFIILAYGLFFKKKWATYVWNIKTLSLSFAGFLISMTPILIYDMQNGFIQTVGFTSWIFYKITKLFFNTNHFLDANIFSFVFEKYSFLTFPLNKLVSGIIFVISMGIFAYHLLKRKLISFFLIGVLLMITLLGFLINQIPSDAYMPIFFPLIIIISGICWDFIISKTKIFGWILLLMFTCVNSLFLTNYISERKEFVLRKNAVREVVDLSSSKEFNLLGKGEGSQFESFIMNYEYLLWYYYDITPSKQNENVKIYVEEKGGGISVTRND